MTMTLIETAFIRALREGDSGAPIVELQKALQATGADIVADGNFGPITKAAVKRFQASVTPAIAVDGFVGPITARYLINYIGKPPIEKPSASIIAIAPWLSRARAQSGINEIPGARSNPVILQWVAELGARYPSMRRNIDWFRNDDTPWCGLFAAQAVGLCDPGFMPDIAPLLAANWDNWDLHLDKPCVGAIGRFSRDGGGHIGFFESEESGFYHIRGGNQRNSVNVSKIAKNRLEEVRWPVNYPIPKLVLPKRSLAQAASVNER
jgi:uncharacterized protein (TIGR02594 family)